MPSFRDQGSWPGPNQLNQHWEMPTGHGKYIIHATLSPAEAETEASLLPHIRLPVTVCWPSQHVSKIPICTKGLRLPLSLLCVLLCVAVCYCVYLWVCVFACVLTSVYFANVRVKSGHLSWFEWIIEVYFVWHSLLGYPNSSPRLDSTLPFPSSDHRYSTGVRSVGRCLVTGFSLLLCPVCDLLFLASFLELCSNLAYNSTVNCSTGPFLECIQRDLGPVNLLVTVTATCTTYYLS